MKIVNLTIAGTCTGDSGRGGWAFVLRMGEHSMERTGGSTQTTKIQMELNAVTEGLKALREPCYVFLNSDNEYLLNGVPFRPDEWRLAEFAQIWKRLPARLPDRDLWQKLDLIGSKHRIQRVYITGTYFHPDKARCDKLAEAHAAQFLGASSLAALLD
jgi:ribonuclease HI